MVMTPKFADKCVANNILAARELDLRSQECTSAAKSENTIYLHGTTINRVARDVHIYVGLF